MQISKWLEVCDCPKEYQEILAFAAVNCKMDVKSRIAYYRLFHFHPHVEKQKAEQVARMFPLSPSHGIRFLERVREAETETRTKVLTRTSIEIPANGSTAMIETVDGPETDDVCIRVS